MREKLIELLGADTCKKECEDCKYCANPEACIEYLKTSMADHLIANGVTMEAYDCHWATETAYKNGYKKGYEDGKRAAAAVTLHGSWIVDVERLTATCSKCGKILRFSDEMQIAFLRDEERYCYYCGVKNDGVKYK